MKSTKKKKEYGWKQKNSQYYIVNGEASTCITEVEKFWCVMKHITL